MATQYLYRVNILSKKNNNPLDSIAYYCGEDQYDVYENKTYKSNNAERVIWSNILIPNQSNDLYSHLPEFLKSKSKKPEFISNARNILWRQVDRREIRSDSQFARVFELSIPFFLNNEESTGLIKNFANELVLDGIICDVSLHSHTKKSTDFNLLDKLKKIQQSDKNNISVDINQDCTAFIMCTLRSYENGMFENKNREWNTKEKMKEWRYKWTEFLLDSIEKSVETTEEQKSNWLKRMTIYPEFYEIKMKKFEKLQDENLKVTVSI